MAHESGCIYSFVHLHLLVVDGRNAGYWQWNYTDSVTIAYSLLFLKLIETEYLFNLFYIVRVYTDKVWE